MSEKILLETRVLSLVYSAMREEENRIYRYYQRNYSPEDVIFITDDVRSKQEEAYHILKSILDERGYEANDDVVSEGKSVRALINEALVNLLDETAGVYQGTDVEDSAFLGDSLVPKLNLALSKLVEDETVVRKMPAPRFVI